MFGEPHLHIHIIFPRSHTFCPAHHRNNLPEPEKLQTDICRFKKNKGSITTGYVFIFLKRLLWLLVYLISSYPIFYWCVTNQAKWLSGFPWLFFFFSGIFHFLEEKKENMSSTNSNQTTFIESPFRFMVLFPGTGIGGGYYKCSVSEVDHLLSGDEAWCP